MLPAGSCWLSWWTEGALGPGGSPGRARPWKRQVSSLESIVSGQGWGGAGGEGPPSLLCLGWGKCLSSSPSLEAGATWAMGGGVAEDCQFPLGSPLYLARDGERLGSECTHPHGNSKEPGPSGTLALAGDGAPLAKGPGFCVWQQLLRGGQAVSCRTCDE